MKSNCHSTVCIVFVYSTVANILSEHGFFPSFNKDVLNNEESCTVNMPLPKVHLFSWLYMT